MSRRLLLVWSIVVAMVGAAALAPDARANGRPPASETIHFQKGNDQNIIVGLTFGLVVSHDGGTTWQWMCEAAVGYAGVWDPIYQWTASGAIFATTFNGLRVNRNGCTFDVTPLGNTFATAFASGPDGALYVAMSDTGETLPDAGMTPPDVKIYKSTDDGMTWNAGVLPSGALAGDWHQSIVVSPVDPNRIYVSGYRFNASLQRVFLSYESTDGGATFNLLPVTDFNPTSNDSTITLVGTSPIDADVLYARVDFETLSLQTSIYRSADAGQTWTKVVCGTLPCAVGAAGVADYLNAFTIDSHDNVYVGSQQTGSWKSTNGGTTFTYTATGTKWLQCLAVNSVDELWGCGDNYGSGAASMMGVGKSSDFTTWTVMLMFQNIMQPVTCSAGVPQYDTCQAMTWCGLIIQLGLTSTVIDCPSIIDAGAVDAAAPPPAKGKGCCDAGAGPSGLALAALVGMLWWLPRRRRHPTPC